MGIDIILSYLIYFSKYLLVSLFLYLFGRSFLLILQSLSNKYTFIGSDIFFTKSNIIYPIFGFFFLGNTLLILNFFLPLKSYIVYLICFAIILLNLLETNFEKKVNYFSLVGFIAIPMILLISTYDTNFHYDAGYYHLGTQNWLRESNIILGFVNIFWPYGVGSIYEYVSSFFWIDKSLQSLHFINLIFISSFFSFCFYHSIYLKNSKLKYVTHFLLVYSFIDNFGISGGRNGFIYIEGITAFDNAVGIIFYFVSIFSLVRIKYEKYEPIELVSLFTLFVLAIQLKISSALVSILFLKYLYSFIKSREIKLKNIFSLFSLNILFIFGWLLKNYLTSGCLIFPINLTCKNNFSWYVPGSTKAFEIVTTEFSKSFTFQQSINEWFNEFFSIQINRTVSLNFIFSFLIIYCLYKIFFTSEKTNYRLLVFIFILSNFLYLLLFGPIPRYATGILLFIISFIGLSVVSTRYTFKETYVVAVIFLFSIAMVPRLTSYKSFISNGHNLEIPEPSLEIKNDFWSTPIPGEDQCWLEQFCTAEKSHNVVIKDGYFKVAYIDK